LDERKDHTDAATFSDASWFPDGLELARRTIRLVETDRQTLSSNAFLDMRWDRTESRRTSVALDAAVADPSAQEKPHLNFIWHSGFCCSTLLAKALDREGRNLSLCEPQILVEVADAKRAPSTPLPDSILGLTIRLLARRFSPEESIVVKPAPAANRLIRDAASLTSGRMLFLYSDCASFLVSIAKMGEVGRKYVRRMFLAIAGDGHPQAVWQPTQLLSLSDLEFAAIVWHMQMAEMRRHWNTLGTARAASLDCDAFLANPLKVLNKVDEFFALEIGEDVLRETVAGPLFQRNAKSGESGFDAMRRREERARIEETLGEDIRRIVRQSYALCRTPEGEPLPDPLVVAEKVYAC
jgi:hypothetical protein